MSFKSTVIERAERATYQAENYVERSSGATNNLGVLGQAIEVATIGIYKAREIGWQTLNVIVSLPEIISGDIETRDPQD